VLEVDTQQGHDVDGPASLAALEARHGRLPQTLQAQSPSGSVHYYFQHPGDGIKVRSTTSELGPGIDTKGDGGMVIAPPSQRHDGTYRWINHADPVPAPDWLLLAICENKAKDDSGNWKEEYPPVGLEMLNALLQAIPNTSKDWERWNRIGMAVYAATNGNDDGLKLFHQWSKKIGGNYNKQQTNNEWEILGSVRRLASPSARCTTSRITIVPAYGYGAYYGPALGAGYLGYRIARRVAIHRARWR